jgi:hypothetical protein
MSGREKGIDLPDAVNVFCLDHLKIAILTLYLARKGER